MDKFIELTSIEYDNGIEADVFKHETKISVNVSHISYFFPDGNRCALCLDDLGAMTHYKDNYTAHSSKFTVKESYDEVRKLINNTH